MRHIQPSRIPVLLFAVFSGVAGCSDSRDQHELLAPELASSIGADTVPARVPGRWDAASAQALWDYASSADSTLVIGLKRPGTSRGIWHGDMLITREELQQIATEQLPSEDVSVQRLIGSMPAALVKITGPRAVEALRRAEFVDYVEPNALRITYKSGGGGCEWEPFTGTTWKTVSGDYMPPNFARADADIDQAWARARGEGVVTGLVDTGISATQDQLLSSFTAGESSGRWRQYVGVGGHSWYMSTCSHGTRMAGVLAAPRDGVNTLGVAWKGNLVSVNQADKVWGVDTDDVVDAIEYAATYNQENYPSRRIIVLAFGSDKSLLVEVAIQSYYANGRLFIGASGSGTMDYPGIAFPADMEEVIAVSAVSRNRTRIDSVNYGDGVEFAFVEHELTVGATAADMVAINASSGATAVVAGIAALAWSAYPTESNIQIRDRLRRNADLYPNRTTVEGFGLINALWAVGGLRVAVGAELIAGSPKTTTETWRLSAIIQQGTGPFSYLWSNGSTAQYIDVTVGVCDAPSTYSVRVTDTFDGAQQRESETIYPSQSGGCDTWE